jgi:ParB-like chromosome segregation protein Spo0J
VHRSALKNAPYNPRRITEAARKKLKNVLGSIGLLEGPVWNRRTGNIVGGHERTRVLDAAHGSADYLLTVSAVDLSEAEEERANLALNAWTAQGDFDGEKLKELLGRHQGALEQTGFDSVDVLSMFGEQVSQLESERLQEIGDRLRKARAVVKEMTESSAERDAPNFYFVVVFPSGEALAAFCERHSLTLDRFQRSEDIERLVGAPPLSDDP